MGDYRTNRTHAGINFEMGETGVIFEPILEQDEVGRYAAFSDAFEYHAPKGNQAVRYGLINAMIRATVKLVIKLCPNSAEQHLAIRKLQEARMWANASIAINEAGKPKE